MEAFEPRVDAAIWTRFPSYRALSVVVRGFEPERTVVLPPPVLPAWCDAHIEAWQRVFREFGSNPKKTLSSLESLARRFRKDGVLPSIHPLVDTYNALSLQFGAPFGGEDVDRYQGRPELVVADGSETFDTVRSGEPITEPADPGEIVWKDRAGVTCRRWNGRQCRRTAIRAESRNLWFVIDRLPPFAVEDLRRAGEALRAVVLDMSPRSTVSTTLLEPLA
jgi:DNA/RNA-binding domain of Phe-tRNA-synthetase-like protein